MVEWEKVVSLRQFWTDLRREDVYASKNLSKHLCPNCQKVTERFRADRKAFDNRMTLRMAIGFLLAVAIMFAASLLRALLGAIH